MGGDSLTLCQGRAGSPQPWNHGDVAPAQWGRRGEPSSAIPEVFSSLNDTESHLLTPFTPGDWLHGALWPLKAHRRSSEGEAIPVGTSPNKRWSRVPLQP